MKRHETWSVPIALAEADSRLPLVAIETVRARPTERVVFSHAKIAAVMQGRITIDSPSGPHELAAGDVFILGAGVWCSGVPAPSVRTWTIYADEHFLRSQASWLLPPAERVRAGMHPTVWDGSALVLRPGARVLNEVEPLWRQMSMVAHEGASDLAASRLVELFASMTRFLIPALLHPRHTVTAAEVMPSIPVLGRMAAPVTRDQVRQAAGLLRDQLAEPWTVGRLAASVAVSPAHLGRLFTSVMGVAPMRYLAEIRLTEFARLVEETDLPIAALAKQVGWNDGRVAAAWFRRRFGVAPSRFRRTRHPACLGEAPCGLCRGLCLTTPGE